MVLLPLLRSLPAARVASVIATLISMTGLDFGRLHLGHPDTAADELVALMMAFSVSAPAFWVLFLALHAWEWAVGFVRHLQNSRQTPDA
jgi:ABC-type dipeptide/oligopeptide/nickel transport system permease component